MEGPGGTAVRLFERYKIEIICLSLNMLQKLSRPDIGDKCGFFNTAEHWVCSVFHQARRVGFDALLDAKKLKVKISYKSELHG